MTQWTDVDDTIVAIASPTSPAQRGVVRLSGPDVLAILDRVGIDCGAETRARRWEVEIDVGPPLGVIPVSLMLWPTARSYTGQPSAELHTFGSLPILEATVAATCVAGARAARPGEFTLRAFLAGRIDLTQAEAVLGVIEAEERGSLDVALRQLSGNLSRHLEQLRDSVLNLLADVEAGLDFVDEDIEFVSDQDLVERLERIDGHLEETWNVMQRRRGGAARVVVALRGEPNAGKSLLVNRLAGRDVAIVADRAGTTRDTVTTEVDFGGQRVTLVDTAGLEETDSEVSRQSQVQAERSSDEATIRLWCVDASRADLVEARHRVQQLAERSSRTNVIELWIQTKADLVSDPTSEATQEQEWISCSALTGQGIELIRQAIITSLSNRDQEEIGSVVGTAARCGQSLQRAREAIKKAIELTQNADGHEFVSAELRTLADSLGGVTGAVYTDDILDRVFSRFCIGK